MRAHGLGWTIGWTLRLAIAGFAMSFLCASVARLGRGAVVAVYLAVVGTLLLAYVRSSAIPLRDYLVQRWRTGLIAGLAVGALLTINVMAQPPSPRPSGVHLVWALSWLGVIYGVVDALLLNVMPVWIVYTGQAQDIDSPRLRERRVLIALGASLLVTAAYHLGYPEFRGSAVVQPLIGNALLTLGFLLTKSPATAIVGHVIMHAAAVVHGMETTVQLPPHY
jgi:hypothetical protein